MEDVKKTLVSKIQASLKNLVGEEKDLKIDLSHPENLAHGDLTTNVAMQAFAKVASRIKRLAFSSPRDLAQGIVDDLQKDPEITTYFSKISVEGPGFINFYLEDKYLFESLSKVASDERFGYGESLKGRKIMIEFTDPNPFKEFHVGHVYSNIVGESISRLLESQEADVRRVCYQGDVGLHVAKAIWGMSKKIQDSGFKIHDLEEKTIQERVKFLGESYALGSSEFEGNEEAKQEIIEINKKIFANDLSIKELYDTGKAWSLEYFDLMYTRLGMKFWKLYFESSAGIVGLEIVKKHIADGVFAESEGAVIFPGEKYGLHNRVFINSLGLPTYEAKELGLAPSKYQDFSYDQSIIITGNEVNAYFQVVLCALNIINPEIAKKTKHISHGMVRLPDGKMSSRSGKIITGEWLLDEAKSKIQSSYNDMKPDTLEKVAIAAVKYALLKSSIGHDIEFNFDESISLEGNSGPYILYAYVRTQSVLSKSQISNLKSQINENKNNQSFPQEYSGGAIINYKFEVEELALMRILIQFPTVVQEASELHSPNLITNYLFILSQRFNYFYQKHTILGDESKMEFRLILTASVGIVLKNGLHILGIESVEKM